MLRYFLQPLLYGIWYIQKDVHQWLDTEFTINALRTSLHFNFDQ